MHLPRPSARAALALLASLLACGGGSGGPTTPPPGSGPGRGFPVAAPWVSFYGPADGLDLAALGATFAVVNLDADPDSGDVSPDQVAALQRAGVRVISYLNVGSCESYRSYYASAPAGHASCVSSGALTTAYGGYPDEKWADLGNAAYRDLLVTYVADRLAAQGVDGFFLDNLEVVEHGAGATEGPCGAACAQGGLDLVWALRQRFPGHLIVMQNASGDVTRLGTSHGVAFPSLLDGLSHEEVYAPPDAQSRAELLAWKALDLTPGGRPFWVAVEEYVGACAAAQKAAAAAVAATAAADGFSPYVTDASGSQRAPCVWASFP
jgi:cysteinyl-tRNA synthetase